MYHPTEMANALTPTSWFYSLFLHNPERHKDNDHPSRLEISFLLDSGASLSVLNYPTYLRIAKILNITCNNKTSQYRNIQDFTLQFKYQSKDHPNTTKSTSLLSKDYPLFSYIYRINSKTQNRLNPNSSKIAHFPINNYYNLHFATTAKNQFFPTIPHTFFLLWIPSKFSLTTNLIILLQIFRLLIHNQIQLHS